MKPMTDAELEALKARHRPSLMDTSRCDTYDCGLWPCPTAHLIADLERAWELLAACREWIQEAAIAGHEEYHSGDEYDLCTECADAHTLLARLNERLEVPHGSASPVSGPPLSAER